MDTNHRLIFKGPFMYEHMVRVPLIIRVPKRYGGRAPRRVKDFDTVNVDLAPTMLDFAGLEPIRCDGFSLKPILTGAEGQTRRDFVVGEYYSKQRWVNPIRMLRTSAYKYTRYIRHGEELYDLENDPNELVNLAGDPKHAAARKELAAKLDAWIAAHKDPFESLRSTDRRGEPLG